MNALKEKFLLARIRHFQDQQAFAQIYQHYSAKVYRYLSLKLPTRPDAEDALASTFLRLWNYLCSSPVESLSGLIFTIARAVVAEYYRSRKENLSLDDFISQEAQVHLSDQGREKAHVISQAEVALLKNTIQRLSEEEQKLIAWRYFEGLSLKEIASRLQKKESAANASVYRALQHLKDLLPSNPSDL